MSHSSTLRRGIFLMIAGSCFFASNDAFSKLALGHHLPASQVLALRGLLAAAMLLGALAWKGQMPALRFGADRRVLMRATAEAGSAFLFITAIGTMSIADAAAVFQVLPLLTMAATVVLFGARIGLKEWAAVGVGFLGVTLIIKPGAASFDPVALLPLAGALLTAFRDIVTGRIGAHVPTLVVTLATTLVGMALGFAGSAVEPWVMPDLTACAYLVGGSLTLICGHTLTIAAFRGNDPAAISPFRYAAVVCSVGLSALLFNAVPDLVSIGGIALITAAGLYSMHQHRPTRGKTRPVAVADAPRTLHLPR